MSQPAQPRRATYDGYTIALHWLTALAVFALFYLGWMMTSDLPSGLTKTRYFALHKSLGVVVFFMGVFRLVWSKWALFPPKITKGLALWEVKMNAFGLKAIYALLVIVPFTGWLVYSASPYKALFFGTFMIPNLPFVPGYEDAPTLFKSLAPFHEISATLLALLLVGHIASAAKHHFKLKDGVLIRMLPPFARVTFMRLREKR